MASIPGYAGWGEAEARADYRAKNGRDYAAPSGLDAQFQGYDQEIDKYIGELMGRAKGDYDFAAKWIENNYKKALGTDDAGTAAFLKKVANGLESKVGRIEFDYDTGVYRANAAADTSKERTQADRTLALQRLDQDEQVVRSQYAREDRQTREQAGAGLNARGLINNSYEKTSGLGGQVIGDVEAGISDRMGALERSLGRNRQDINTSADRNLFDTDRSLKYGLEDLTTGARRGAQDEQDSRQYGLDSAGRQRDNAIAQLEAQKRGLKTNLKSLYGSQLSSSSLGY